MEESVRVWLIDHSGDSTYLLGNLLHLAAADVIAAAGFAVAIAGAALALILRIGHKVRIILRIDIGIAIQYLING